MISYQASIRAKEAVMVLCREKDVVIALRWATHGSFLILEFFGQEDVCELNQTHSKRRYIGDGAASLAEDEKPRNQRQARVAQVSVPRGLLHRSRGARPLFVLRNAHSIGAGYIEIIDLLRFLWWQCELEERSIHGRVAVLLVLLQHMNDILVGERGRLW